MALYEAMTLFHTFGRRKGLWITFLTTCLGFFIVSTAHAILINFEDGTTQGLYGTGGSAIIATTSNSYTGIWSGLIQDGAGLITYDYGGATSSGNYFLAYFGNYFPANFVLSDNAGLTGCNFNATGTWHIAGIEWSESNFRCYSDGVWSGWNDLGLTFSRINIAPVLSTLWIDDLNTNFPPDESYLIINSPVSGSTASTTFPLDFTYNFLGQDFNKIYVVFEAWNNSSTCPVYGTDEWQTQYNAGWFYNQSFPFFSPRLTATSTEATSSILVSNIEEPFFYNCNYCYFYNSDTASSTLANKCPDYILNVSGFITPNQPLPIEGWQSYYASHTDSKYPTSTAIFDSITGSFSSIVQKLASFVNDFKTLFDSASAYENGANLGEKIPIVRGYLAPINSFFGTLPISELFIFFIIALLVVVVYRIVARILHLVRG